MATRKVIKIPGMGGHRNPIPIGVVLGNVILPSVISGANPGGATSKDPEQQIAQAFVNMKNIIEAGGGTTANIGKITFYVKDMAHRDFINNEWLKMFPDEEDRPARHVIKTELQGDLCIQMDVIAMV